MTEDKERTYINLSDVVGGGYATFWNSKARYRVVKGSRASKKSKTTALNLIKRTIQYPQANTLVVRKTARSLKDSCYADLKWACNRLQVANYFDFREIPLEITYRPTGQKILFRGLDDPLKITSISVPVGCLCWLWIEEAYEITSEEDFNILDESIRGVVPPGLFKQTTLTFNPWNERIWLKRRFFDVKDPNVLALTTNYKCNEWLDKQDIELFESMKTRNPRRYQVAGLGEWGISEGLIYENWHEETYDIKELIKSNPKLRVAFGMDFGYVQDPTALVCMLVDNEAKRIYIFDEMYKRGLTNNQIADEIKSLGYGKERITCDSAEPKSIDELKGYGLRVKGARKGKDSIMNGIQFIQNYELIVHSQCTNFITELSNYTWDKDKYGNMINTPIDDFNHGLDAMRYGMEDFITTRGWLV